MIRDLRSLAIAATASCLLAGCGWMDRHFHHENDDYKKSVQEHPLEVPPDLDRPNATAALQIPEGGAASTTTTTTTTTESAPPPAGAVAEAAAPGVTAGAAPGAVLSGDALHISDSVDSTWNRIGLAMERSGAATILARDEAGRTFDVQTTAQVTQKPSLFKKVLTLGMAKGKTTAQVRLKLRVTAEGDGSKVAVEGASDDASKEAAQTLLSTLKQRLS